MKYGIFFKINFRKKVNVKPLISDIVPAEKTDIAYKKLEKDPVNTIGVLLKFSKDKEHLVIVQKQEINEKKTKKIIIGLIGCGDFAQCVHLPILLSNSNCKIKGICTHSKKNAELCKQRYNPEFITTNYKKILRDPEIDTVFIYTRHDTHVKFTIEALNANKNVSVEKPMGLTIEQCYNVYRSVKASKKNYMIGFNRRYCPFIKIAKDLLNNK